MSGPRRRPQQPSRLVLWAAEQPWACVVIVAVSLVGYILTVSTL